ncbi:MAG: hypothetical protein A3C06_03905 [Candidatus Taylorbacteria bacterium RIFCSPHIGHO2_02_FULL_46_13]|uniref:Exonuclease domain-containing protein n=1 Tax=Candidatus Taylorbacteria bacterium RIFCSPHIGHO2_02_FULL_46_13 TaxID=1802312 RepID=A0A1G2MSY3_9BACT|nr:MAG: hypothetical protein A3C06_03905 [Candidatus Taylorbacteria bacterium RIFCSPHIGHO2_02_FULL_46_13]
MLGLPSTIIVFDTEYTSWEGAQERGWSGPNEYKEIVEMGAVRVETETPEFKELDSLQLLVKPVKNPKLSEYFTNLMGITQEAVDIRGMSLAEAVKKFYTWSSTDTLYCWGFDGHLIGDNCKLIGTPFSFPLQRFKDVRELFSAHGIKTNKYMSSTIVEAFGVKKTKAGHNGLDDARTIVDGLRLLAARVDRKV